MCTLVIGRDVAGPGTLLLGANRDEDPDRPADPPGVLQERPRVVGGRDLRAGGTWLAFREGPAVVAILNRHDPASAAPGATSDRRSRGLLAIDVATVSRDFPSRGIPAEEMSGARRTYAPPGLLGAALQRALVAVSQAPYAPFTLVFGTPQGCWALALDRMGEPRVQEVPVGWHVLTHRDLDDPSEPRAARLVVELLDFRPAGPGPGIERLQELLRSHGDHAAPPVCLHEGPMSTVSSSILWLDEPGGRYLHAEGRPCEREYQDCSELLAADTRAGRP